MKNIISLLKAILIFETLLFGCTKVEKQPARTGTRSANNPPPDSNQHTVGTPPPPTDSPVVDLNVRVVEYQTNIPLDSALYSRYYCENPMIVGTPGCTYDPFDGTYRLGASLYTNIDGYVYIKGFDTIGNLKPPETPMDLITKKNYWSAGLGLLTGNGSVKTATVTMDPYAWLKIHLKIVKYTTGNATMFFDPENFPALDSERREVILQHMIKFGASADTTFIIKTAANRLNQIFVEVDTVGYGERFDQLQVYFGNRYVDKFDTLDWEILIQ